MNALTHFPHAWIRLAVLCLATFIAGSGISAADDANADNANTAKSKAAPAPAAKPKAAPAKAAPAQDPAAAKAAAPAKAAAQIDPLDWPTWRGPEMNGISREKGLISNWSPEGENLLWTNKEVAGRSTPIVLRGKMYCLCRNNPGTTKEGEKVVCLDAATGKKIWENAFNVYLSDVPDTRVGWSSVVGDPTTGHVFALGVGGVFQGIDGETGKTLWSHSMSEEYGLLTTYGGRTNFPTVFEDLVIISGVMTGWGELSVPAHRFAAFDKRTGQAVWLVSTRLRPEDTTYSTPVFTVFNGQAAMVVGAGDGSVYAFQPRTGKVIWQYDASMRGINTTPVVAGNTVFCGHSEMTVTDTTLVGAVFAIDGTGTGDVTKTKELWNIPEITVGRSAPLYVNGRLYVVTDGGALLTLDPKTGEKIGQQKLGTTMIGSPVYGDGKIYAGEATGRWYILEPNEKKGVKIVNKVSLEGEAIQASPIISHGRIYVMTDTTLYCVGEKGQTPSADPRPASPQEAPPTADPKPAQVQLVPAEVVLKPGEKQSYQVRFYNSKGRYLELAKAEFELKGPGKIDEAGVLTVPPLAAPAATQVTAKVGELTGSARVRIFPPLPWSFDFSNQVVPLPWVGTSNRYISLDADLLAALESDDPMAARMYVAVMTSFVNSRMPVAKFDETPPRHTWTELLRFFGLNEGDQKPKTLDEAKKLFEPALARLQKEKVIEKWTWGAGAGPVAKPAAGGAAASKDAAAPEAKKSGEEAKAAEPKTAEPKTAKPEGAAAPAEPAFALTVMRGSRPAEGNGALLKVTTIPKGTRSQSWIGPPTLHDYTIQADFKGSMRNGKIPDMGLINQRYTLDMMGSSQQLQIRSWTTQLEQRFAKTIPFSWKPNVWYTMKFQSENKDGKAVLRGKVWPRDEKEPEGWTTEAADETPNVVGSPGLFGNASDAEILIDNVKVTPNTKE